MNLRTNSQVYLDFQKWRAIAVIDAVIAHGAPSLCHILCLTRKSMFEAHPSVSFVRHESSAPVCTGPGLWQDVQRTEDLGMQQHHCPAALSFHSESYTPGNVERNECCSGISQPRLLAKSKRWFSTKRFVACDGSSVPSTVDVLGRLGNRSVAFVGDSVTSQLFNALIADLVAHGQTVDYVHRWAFRDIRPSDLRNDGMCTIKNSGRHGGSELHLRLDPRDASPSKVTGYQGGSDPHKWGMRPVCLSIPEQEVELRHYAVRFSFYRMDMRTRDGKLGKYKMSQQWTDALGHCASAWHNFVGRLDGALRVHDAVVANFGMWYARECPARNRCGLDKYRDDLRHVLSRLQTLAPLGKLGLFRESNPQHFATPDGSGLFEIFDKGSKPCSRCEALGPAFVNTSDWRNAALEEVAQELGFPRDNIVRYASLLRPMHALHKPSAYKCRADCTHYCYNPQLWTAQLDGIYRHLYNWASTTRRVE